MDAQSDSCEPPPCDPQPPGKIRKALKLFSKRKPGSGVASIFSVRVKGDGGFNSPPSRGKTLDGLAETVASQAEAESLDQALEDNHKEDAALDEPTSTKNNLESISTRQSISSLTSAKSLSFLSIFRRNRKGGWEEREAQTESHRYGQQRKGLKSLFGSVRWHRKDKEEEDEVLPGHPLLASRSNSVEIMKENLTLTPRPARHSTDELEFEQQLPPSQDDCVTPEDTNKVSGAAKPSTNNRLSTVLGDSSSILSLESLAGGGDIVGDVEAEWVKVCNCVEIEARTVEAVKTEKALLAPKATFSAAPTLSSTSATVPSYTTKLISSSSPPKPILSPTTKQALSPPSTPSHTTSTEPIPSHISPPTFSLTSKPVPSPVLSQASSPVPSPNTIPVLITIPKSPPTTLTLTIPTKPILTPTSPLTPETSPKPSPTLSHDPSPATISEILISLTEKAPHSSTAFAIITQPTHTPSPTTKLAPTAVLTPITRTIHSTAKDTKHSTAPVTKYPPFITSTKPLPTAPVIRPKIVTTFGLSTSRNTAPIIKPEPKQSVHQIKLGPFQCQTEKNGSGSVVPKASPAGAGPPLLVKHLFAASIQSTPASSSATSEHPPHKPDVVHTSLPSGSSLLPTLLTRPVPIIAPCYVPRGEKGQEDGASPRVLEDSQLAFSYRPEKKTLVMKPTTLSKIPVSGGGKSKHYHKDFQSNGEERQTPVLEEDTLISLSQETSNKDSLSDTESGSITPVQSYSNEDILDSAAHPAIGTVSISRESKIPIKPGSTATYHSFQGKTEVARSKIPVSKMPIRTSNKTGPTSTVTATQK